jgi:hypothetical protein
MQRALGSRRGLLRPAAVAALLGAGTAPAGAASLEPAPYDPEPQAFRTGPIALGQSLGLVLSLGLGYGEPGRGGEGTVLGYSEGETALRLGVQTPGFKLSGTMRLGERLTLDGDLGIAHDSLVGMAGQAGLDLTYRW